METPIGDDDDSHLGDFIEDTNNTAPDRCRDAAPACATWSRTSSTA